MQNGTWCHDRPVSSYDQADRADAPKVSSEWHDDHPTSMWIFHGDKARYASGLFTTAEEGLGAMFWHLLNTAANQLG